ncbi:hypothetical protein SLAV_38120 [Streptomyces lavendulae subsp. lavendulae]|uniref:Uncharacterized protein n=1 Tax=Streptomyces lavendulae subsp. lavendulae TaxID=58340 RepID=A0A2K8PSF6_STRLA|nr:hypothetical protein SLAV_38120 [Streptomyces lavendulae subsp. lavendulae]
MLGELLRLAPSANADELAFAARLAATEPEAPTPRARYPEPVPSDK